MIELGIVTAIFALYGLFALKTLYSFKADKSLKYKHTDAYNHQIRIDKYIQSHIKDYI